ncbi:MAG: hypothetical protein LH472_15160 [Pyrinomonadaceae bacterium]|nr:hypothetical protein [Pyrinomonadaceae bacterium]
MNKLTELKSLLSKSGFLNFTAFDGAEIDEMLDRRDDSEFEEDWLRVFQELEQKSFTDDDLAAIKNIREIAYQKTFEATEHGELAAYVADDFEMIAKSLFAEFSDEWLNALFLAYLHGAFPHTKIAPRRSGLELILETASLQKLAA